MPYHESITGTPDGYVELESGEVYAGVPIRIFPGWIRISANDDNHHYIPREQIVKVET